MYPTLAGGYRNTSLISSYLEQILKPARIMSMTVSTVREGFPRPFPNTPSNVLEQFNMSGKVVVVTGSADGIGLAVATAMVEANAYVAMWYNSYVP